MVTDGLDIFGLVELLGLPRAADLSAELGGRSCYVPRSPGSPLVHFLTAAELARLRDQWGGEQIVIPKSQPVVISKLYFVDGLGMPEIGARLNAHERTVRRNVSAGPHPLVEAYMRSLR
ncbi:hypothetical protein [Salinarimonas chemoclinalis]|uniref:hypothetical protein n=1 Tax=Salinarimonas chemoclinalis TaxID=3241599 RepID=UPI003559208A